MKISRMADEQTVPAWALKNEKADEIEKAAGVLKKGLEHLNVTQACAVSDKELTTECDRIDVCAQSDETYYYNSTWDKEDISHLMEYAKVAGLGEFKIVPLDPDAVIVALDQIGIERTAMSEGPMAKTASAENGEITPDDFKFDPLRLAEIMNTEDAKPDVWETVSKQTELANKPSMEGSVRPIRGGEDTSINNNPSIASNQNSIDNPNVIQELAESDVPDTGARLAAEQVAKVEAKKAEHAQWEKDQIEAMPHADIVSKGKVFPTEALNAHSGIKDGIMAAHSSFDPKNDMPEKTAGELLKEKNTVRKESIQRETADDKAWDSVQSQSSFGVSDVFAESLKQQLSK